MPGVAEGDLYKFEIRARSGHVFLKTDPYAFYTETSPATASVVPFADQRSGARGGDGESAVKPERMIPMNSPAKLTDTQFAMLSEASQRKDRCLIPPKTLKAAAAQKVATKLLKAGLVREIKAKTGAQVIELLQRGDGATLAELVAATGWLPHTTRAALTGLRKRGYAVGIDRADKVRGSVYRIEPTEMEEDSAAPHAEASQTCEAPPDRPGRAASLRTRRAA